MANVQQQSTLDGFYFASEHFNCFKGLRKKSHIDERKNKQGNYFDSQQLLTTFGRLTRIPQKKITTTSYAPAYKTCQYRKHITLFLCFFHKLDGDNVQTQYPGSAPCIFIYIIFILFKNTSVDPWLKLRQYRNYWINDSFLKPVISSRISGRKVLKLIPVKRSKLAEVFASPQFYRSIWTNAYKRRKSREP